MEKAPSTLFAIFVPINNNDGTKIDEWKLEDIRKELGNRFKGTTQFPQKEAHAIGMWVYKELPHIDNIEIYATVTNEPDAISFFKNYGREIAQRFQQESVFILALPVSSVS
jgi:hypothetical protein